jgi:predicted RNase H-like HicB family nuclease
VFYKDNKDWIAHCLEFDLMGDGATKKEALDQLSNAISIQVETSLEYDNPVNLFKPADGKFFAMFAAGTDVAVGELHLKIDSVTIDETETREYIESGTEQDSLLASV